jgi:electron transfer flavoprotein beta subunit
VLKHAAALGANRIAAIDAGARDLDCRATAALLAAYIVQSGGADAILCGRQASDDDQGVVPPMLGEMLDMPVITIARALEMSDYGGARAIRVTRVTPNGDEVVEATLPAVITVSNELGQVRYPTAAQSIAARRMHPDVFTPEMLGLAAEALLPRVKLERIFVPALQGDCEFIEGTTPAAQARTLVERLRAEGLVVGAGVTSEAT